MHSVLHQGRLALLAGERHVSRPVDRPLLRLGAGVALRDRTHDAPLVLAAVERVADRASNILRHTLVDDFGRLHLEVNLAWRLVRVVEIGQDLDLVDDWEYVRLDALPRLWDRHDLANPLLDLSLGCLKVVSQHQVFVQLLVLRILEAARRKLAVQHPVGRIVGIALRRLSLLAGLRLRRDR